MDGSGSIAERLGRYTRSVQYETLPHEVVHEVKRRLIDSLACVFGAYDAEPCGIARQTARSVRIPAGATVLGTRHRTSPELASFANGTMLRYLDHNDTYLSKEPAHPSDNIPAALALAEAERRDAKEFIASVVVGYEVQCRLADAASLRARGWDHVTYGSFSSACVASRLLALPPEQAEHAIALAGVANNALRQTRAGTLSMWKACAFANAARNGVFAARLAQQGMTAPSDIFEGQFGFWNLVSGPFELGPLGGQDAEPYRILATYIKFFPAEYHAQAAIEVALKLRPELPSVDAVAGIDIETYDACVDIIADPEKWRPTTRETADHSLPYCVAVALADGELTLRSFAPQRISDPALHQLMQKIRVHRNPEFSAQYPEAMICDVRLQLDSGTVLQARGTHAHGHPKNPMTDEEVENKFRALTAAVFRPSKASRILERLWRLEEVADMGSLPRLLVSTATQKIRTV